MNSDYLIKISFKKFDNLDCFEFKKNEHYNNLKCTGIYVLVRNKKFERLIGKTDILYIGQSGGAKNGKGRFISERLNDYRVGSRSAPQDRRIHDSLARLIEEDGDVILFYKKIEKDKCKQEEKELLRQFSEEHIELPPLNKQS